jgi:hypothetical protein
MMIHTPRSLRLEARMETAASVLAAMRRGAALHLQYARTGPRWTLTTGHRICEETAKLVTASSSVVGVGDALFAGAASQTWRWWNAEGSAA